MATAPGEVGADPSIGYCACLRRELSGEPDAGNLHLWFDEGRVDRAMVSPSLLLYRWRVYWVEKFSTGVDTYAGTSWLISSVHGCLSLSVAQWRVFDRKRQNEGRCN